jgi:hypothetical protein
MNPSNAMTGPTDDPSSFAEPRTNTERDAAYRRGITDHFAEAQGSTYEKLWNFSRFVPRQRLTMFLSKYEIMKLLVDVQGSIVEVGVHFGGGLFDWLQMCEILEPRNYQRTIHGFDTFEGFSSISTKDDHAQKSVHLVDGGLKGTTDQELIKNARIYDLARTLGHIPKVFLHKGNALETIPALLQRDPQLVVSLLYLDVDLYEPTKVAIGAFYDRMPKGGVIVFDELNCDKFPGETLAVHEAIGIGNLRIRRSPFDTWMSYAVKE